MFCKKGVLKNFAKFTGKCLCQSLFFNKAAGLRSTTLLKKRLWHRCFPVKFAKLLRTPIFKERLRWLLLEKCFLQLLSIVSCLYLRSVHRLLIMAVNVITEPNFFFTSKCNHYLGPVFWKSWIRKKWLLIRMCL